MDSRLDETLDNPDWEGMRLLGHRIVDDVVAYLQTVRERPAWQPIPAAIRKGFEAYFTLLIETCWPKTRILEVYLNVAEFGQGVFGIGAASELFFRQPAARLNRSQSALLAAALPNPTTFLVTAPSRYVRTRQAWILQQMNALGGEPAGGESRARSGG